MGWVSLKLSDLCLKITDGSHNPPKGIDWSEHLMLSSKNVFDDFINTNKPRYLTESDFKSENKRTAVESGDVLLTIVGTVGRVAVVDDSLPAFTLQRSVAVLKPNLTKVSPRFLMYSLQSLVSRLLGESRGVAQKGLYLKTLRGIEIPLPPIPEQQRIVAILDQAFADIEKARANAERNLKNVRELFDSYAQNIFSQKKDGWLERSLGELGKVSMCKRILKKQTSASGEIPFYKIGTFGKTANAFIDSDLYEDYKTRFSFPKVGDILISASGTIGRCVVYDGQPAYFQDSNIVWIDNNERLVLNEYLLHFYKVCDWNPSKGATISRLYNDDLRKIKIAFPSKSEQLRVSKDISELNKEILSLQLIYGKKLASLDELKKSLLQKAFSGELTKTEGHAA